MIEQQLRTPFTDLVGVRHPVVQTGMGWVSGPRLVSGTANAGGLGILASATEVMRRQGLQYQGQVHVIVADCCIESWLLGHRRLVPRQPADTALAELKRFYDVSQNDPERMGCPSGHPLERARFHHEYLRQIFWHHGQSYTKERPGIATEANYLAALRDRCLDPAHAPAHLASFRVLWDTWSALGGRYDVEAELSAS